MRWSLLLQALPWLAHVDVSGKHPFYDTGYSEERGEEPIGNLQLRERIKKGRVDFPYRIWGNSPDGKLGTTLV